MTHETHPVKLPLFHETRISITPTKNKWKKKKLQKLKWNSNWIAWLARNNRCLPFPYVPVIPLAFLLYQSNCDSEGHWFQIHTALYYLRCPRLIFQFSECLTGSCGSTIFVSRFLLLRELRLDLDVRVFEECFTMCSWTPVNTFSLDGSSGGASGHGVRFDGMVISKGGSIIHLYKTRKKIQCMLCMLDNLSSQ